MSTLYILVLLKDEKQSATKEQKLYLVCAYTSQHVIVIRLHADAEPAVNKHFIVNHLCMRQ